MVDGNVWRIRINRETEAIVVKFIKAQQLSWLGHIERQTSGLMTDFYMEANVQQI